MNREHLIGFATRDRGEIDELRAEYWRERKQRLGPAEGLRVAELLRRHVVSLAGPPPLDEGDSATHSRVSEMMRAWRPSQS